MVVCLSQSGNQQVLLHTEGCRGTPAPAAPQRSHSAPSKSVIRGRGARASSRPTGIAAVQTGFSEAGGESGAEVAATYLSPGNGELLLTLLTVGCFIIFQPCVALRKKTDLRTSPPISPWWLHPLSCDFPYFSWEALLFHQM